MSTKSVPAAVAAASLPRKMSFVETDKAKIQRKRSTSIMSTGSKKDAEDPTKLRASQSLSRMPYHYDPTQSSHRSALASRYRYYAKLDPRRDSELVMPHHVIPTNFFSITLSDSLASKQSSIVTIFSIWNTMVGSALLTMPWALNQAGLVLGLALMVSMSFIAFYTAYRVVKCPSGLPVNRDSDVPEVMRYFWGRKGEIFACICSITVFIAPDITYWILMSNFMFNTGSVFYDSIQPQREFPTNAMSFANQTNNILSETCRVVCIAGRGSDLTMIEKQDIFYKIWQLKTVPIYLAIFAFPLLSFENPSFFTKFNGLGTVSLVYLIAFVAIKAFECGFHLDFSAKPDDVGYINLANTRFPALTGTLSLSLFIHNAILGILRNQRNPENNVRDLSIGYILSTLTYLFVAFLFYSSFPLAKNCIADNLLDNFAGGDVLTSVARLFLLFQILTVFPLITYVIRAHFSFAMTGNVYPGKKWVLAVNTAVLIICMFFAIVYPSVGDILRFVGSFAGGIYLFGLPCLIYMKKQKHFGNLTVTQIVIHSCIILIGVANFIAQFLIL